MSERFKHVSREDLILIIDSLDAAYAKHEAQIAALRAELAHAKQNRIYVTPEASYCYSADRWPELDTGIGHKYAYEDSYDSLRTYPELDGGIGYKYAH